jgi:Rrf2 family transcriptional regulator, iron-sulfur cluster assembly transcription factor
MSFVKAGRSTSIRNARQKGLKMLFTTTTEYAIRGVSELAMRSFHEPVLLADLVEGTDLPREFLAKVFQRLVKAGILHSAKGRGGGFSFARPPTEISMMDILIALEGQQHFGGCVLGLDRCNDQMPCPQHENYKPVRHRLRDYLTQTTVADLAKALTEKKRHPARPVETVGNGRSGSSSSKPDDNQPLVRNGSVSSRR